MSTLSRIEVRSLGAERIGDGFLRRAEDVVARRQFGRFYDAAGNHQEGFVAGLEAAFARWTGAPYAVATTTGSQALVLALAALGASGGEVIVPEYAAAQCALAALAAGCRVVLCRPREDLSLDPEHAAALVTPDTRAVLVVHMRGIPTDVAAVRRAVGAIPIVEDCSQFDGLAFAGGAPQSPYGDVGVFSFQARKLITAGEGGMLTCRDEALARIFVQSCDTAWFMRPQYADWPAPERVLSGTRMNEITAAMIAAQLDDIEAFTERLRALRRALEAHLDVRTRAIDWAEVGGTVAVRCDRDAASEVRARLSAAGFPCFPESAGVADPHSCVGWPAYIRERIASADPCVARLLGATLLLQVDPAWQREDLDWLVGVLT